MLAQLQITVGHWTLADQNLLVLDEITPMLGHYFPIIFFL